MCFIPKAFTPLKFLSKSLITQVCLGLFDYGHELFLVALSEQNVFVECFKKLSLFFHVMFITIRIPICISLKELNHMRVVYVMIIAQEDFLIFFRRAPKQSSQLKALLIL